MRKNPTEAEAIFWITIQSIIYYWTFKYNWEEILFHS